MATDQALVIEGLDLRVARTGLGVRLGDVARAYGVTHQRIARLERTPRPRPATIARYMAALFEASGR